MPSYVKFCSCHGCKVGKPCAKSKAQTREKIKGYRATVKRSIQGGNYDPPKTISAGFTDLDTSPYTHWDVPQWVYPSHAREFTLKFNRIFTSEQQRSLRTTQLER